MKQWLRTFSCPHNSDPGGGPCEFDGSTVVQHGVVCGRSPSQSLAHDRNVSPRSALSVYDDNGCESSGSYDANEYTAP